VMMGSDVRNAQGRHALMGGEGTGRIVAEVGVAIPDGNTGQDGTVVISTIRD
jgi:hypothetical protein